MADRVTRCPHCQTSFRIREEHLKAARGAVRCGSCLEVFNALENLINAHEPDIAASKASSKPVAATPRSQATTTRLANQQSVTATPQPSAAQAASNQPVSEPRAPSSSNQGTSLEDQKEVAADELFDSLFGESEQNTNESEIFVSLNDDTAADDPAPSSNWGEEISDFGDLLGDSLSGGDDLDTPKQDLEPPQAISQSISRSEQHIEDDDSDDFLIHDDMDDEDEDEDEMISDDPFADLGLREPDSLDRPQPLAGLDIDEDLLDAVTSEAEDLYSDPEEEEVDDEAWAQALLEDDEETPEAIAHELGLTSDVEEYHARKSVSSPHNTAQSTTPVQSDTSTHSSRRPYSKDTEHVSNEPAFTRRKPSVNFELADDEPTEERHQEAPQTSSRTIEIPTRAMREIQPEPIKLNNANAKTSDDGEYMGWVFGSVALLLLATGQLFYFNFDQWARTPQWRPVYSSVCSLTGCNIPTIQNVKRMKARNLVVRSHPNIANALVVDTLLQNESPFPQPFPDLVLIFRDLNENIVASRQFTPIEYLSGELSGQNEMPSRTPIHVGIEILDPGQNAVSYAIQLAQNQ